MTGRRERADGGSVGRACSVPAVTPAPPVTWQRAAECMKRSFILKGQGSPFIRDTNETRSKSPRKRVILTILGPGSFRRASVQQRQHQLEAPVAPGQGQVGAGAHPHEHVQDRLQEHLQHVLRPLLFARCWKTRPNEAFRKHRGYFASNSWNWLTDSMRLTRT